MPTKKMLKAILRRIRLLNEIEDEQREQNRSTVVAGFVHEMEYGKR